MCTMRELRDGTYTIVDVFLFNKILDEEAEYHKRYRDAMERKRKAEEKR